MMRIDSKISFFVLAGLHHKLQHPSVEEGDPEHHHQDGHQDGHHDGHQDGADFREKHLQDGQAEDVSLSTRYFRWDKKIMQW